MAYKLECTMDYEKFSFVEGNRPILMPHVDELIKSFAEKRHPIPIIVDSKFRIYDGQHSFTAAKATNQPVYYVVDDSLEPEDCARLNSGQKNWSERDFVNCFAVRGNDNYIRLLADADEMHVSVRIPLNYFHITCHKAASKGVGINPLKDGTLIYTPEMQLEFRREFPKAVQLADYCGAKMTSNFMNAAFKLIQTELCDFDKLLTNAEQYGKHLWFQAPTIEGCLTVFSSIYDYRRASRSHFEDLAFKKVV